MGGPHFYALTDKGISYATAQSLRLSFPSSPFIPSLPKFSTMNINTPSEKYIVVPGRWKRKNLQDVESQRPATRDRRLRGIGWMPNKVRNHFIAMLGEFVGTFMFLFFAFSATQVANTTPGSGAPNTTNMLYIALAFGFSLAVNAWVFFRISGGLFNPAVSPQSLHSVAPKVIM